MNSLDGRTGPRAQSPNRDIARTMKQSGMTYAQIGAQLGISRQRAQQLVSPTSKRLNEIRDALGGKCNACGKRSSKLEAHHSDYSGEPDKLLCTSCHKLFDNYKAKGTAEMKLVSRLNKTELFQIRMTPKLKNAIVKCARQLGVSPTEWGRSTLANQVMEQCFRPASQQEQKGEAND